jgi:hypothetical protein
MNSPTDIEERFAILASEVTARPGFARAVLERANKEPLHGQPAASLLAVVRSAWRWAGVLAAALLIAVAAWLASQPRSLSAQMLAALAGVGTVHVTGTTGRIVRAWPLEGPAAAKADSPALAPFDAWYWTDEHGMPRSYERQGPITVIRRGGALREYQRDADLLYISEGGFVKDRVQRFARLADYLAALERPGLVKRNLGTRREGGVTLAGTEVRQGDRVQTIWWNAATMLPVRASESESRDGHSLESRFAITYNEPVPAEVAHYEPPKAAKVRHGGSGSEKAPLAWREHVAEIGRRLNERPDAVRVEVLPREGGRRFATSWTLPTPDGRYKVTPLCGRVDDLSTLADFLRLHVAIDGDPQRRLATWRVPKEFCDLVYRHDVVYRSEAEWPEWVQAALLHFGLEFADVEETRTFWIARHDARSGKPTGPVSPPVPYIVEGGIEKKGSVECGVGMRLVPVTLETLFADFNTLQARDMKGESVIIEDQTGLARPPKFDPKRHGTWEAYFKSIVEPKYPMATDSPYFLGEGSLEMARKWYREEFGITFSEETRPITVHVVRRKEP